MEQENRLIYEQLSSAVSKAPSATPNTATLPAQQLNAPQIRAALEKAEEQTDIVKRLAELRGIIESQQTADGRLNGIEQLLKVDTTLAGRELAEELLDAEIARDNEAKRAEVLNRSELQQLSLRVNRARSLQANLDATAIGSAPIPETKTDAAMLSIGVVAQNTKRNVERTWDNMNDLLQSPNRKEIFKQMNTTDKVTTTVVGVGSVIIAGFAMAKMFSFIKKRIKKFRNKEELNDEDEDEKKGKSIFKSKGFWAGIAAVGVGTLAYFGLSGKYKKMAAEYAKGKVEDAKNYTEGKVDDAKGYISDKLGIDPTQTTQDEERNLVISNAKESTKITQLKIKAKAFIFENREIIGRSDENKINAIAAIANNFGNLHVQNLLQLNTNEKIQELFKNEIKRDATDSELSIIKNITAIAISKNTNEQSSISDMLNATIVGRAAMKLQPILEKDGLENLDLKKVTEAVFQSSQEEMVDTLNQPGLSEALQSIGLSKEEFKPFITYCLANNTNINDAINENNQFSAILNAMKNEIFQQKTMGFLKQFTQNKELAKIALIKQLGTSNKTELQVLDVVQLFTYLQLAKKESVLPSSVKDSNGTGAFMLQLKTLNLIAKNNENSQASVSLKAKLLVEILTSVENQSINLPSEAIKNLQKINEMAKAAAVSWFTKIGSELAYWTMELPPELAKKYPFYTTLLALFGAAEVKNMWENSWLKGMRNMNSTNAHKFGFYGEKSIDDAVRNADEFAEIQKAWKIKGLFKRIPGLSQLITKRYIIMQRHYSQMSIATGDKLMMLKRFKEAGMPHITESVIDQIQRITKLSMVDGAGSLGDVKFIERLQLAMQQKDLSTLQKIRSYILKTDGVNWERTEAIYSVIENIKHNKLPDIKMLQKAGLDAAEINKAMSVFTEESIGKLASNTVSPNQEVAKTALSTQFTEADLKQAEQNINSTDTTKRQRRNIGSKRQTVAGAGEAKQELEINPTTEEGTSKKADGDSNIKGKK